MPCRIGMTTNLEQRKAQWLVEYPDLYNWEVIGGPFVSKDTAQIVETQLANTYGCVSHPGGDEPDLPESMWHIYRFYY